MNRLLLLFTLGIFFILISPLVVEVSAGFDPFNPVPSATAVDCHTVQINWGYCTEYYSGYDFSRIQRSDGVQLLDSTGNQDIGRTFGACVQTYNDTTVTGGNTYYYTVQGFDCTPECNKKAENTTNTITVPACSPSAPGPFSYGDPVPSCSGATPIMSMSWTGSTNGDYYIEYRSDGAQTPHLPWWILSVDDNTVSPGTDYKYGVAAYTNGGVGTAGTATTTGKFPTNWVTSFNCAAPTVSLTPATVNARVGIPYTMTWSSGGIPAADISCSVNTNLVSGSNVWWVGSIADSGSRTLTPILADDGNTYTHTVTCKNIHSNLSNSASSTVTVRRNDAQYQSQVCPPTEMITNQSSSGLSVTMKNTGTTTWTPSGATPHSLSLYDSTGSWGGLPFRIYLTTSIAPLSFNTFNYSVSAPSTLGTYQYRYQMIEELVQLFGDISPYCTSTIYSPVTVTCTGSPNPSTGAVSWTATASGGKGAGTYTYSWSGTDSLSGSSNPISKTYTTSGNKTATVTATSGSLPPSGPYSCSVLVDTTPPSIPTISVGGIGACYAASTWPGSFTISSTDNESGISKITYHVRRESTGLCFDNVATTFTASCAAAEITAFQGTTPYPTSATPTVSFPSSNFGSVYDTYSIWATAYNGILPTPLLSSTSAYFDYLLYCGKPFLQLNGSVHSNTGINIPGTQGP